MSVFPLPLAVTSGLEYGLRVSSPPGIAICLLLAVLSIYSWSAMVSKLRLLKKAQAANVEFLHVFRHSAHPLAVFQSRERFDASPCFHIYYFAAQELAFHLVGVDQPDRLFATRMQGAERINPTQMAAVQIAMDRAAAEAALRFESRLSAVSMALSGAPFIGLLGTVWGVMDSFAAMAGSEQGSVGMQAMAPGICAALVTTVVGLLVAIPSMFGYNLLVTRIRSMVVRLDNFVSELCGVFDRHYVEHGRSGAAHLPGVLGMEPSIFSSEPTGPLAHTLGGDQSPLSVAPIMT
jgi:biopolymer transport protein TolQ